MRHVLVETNWVFAVATPSHYRVPAALDLLARAGRGEFVLEIPSFCLSEARDPIRRKQPRIEADAIRSFLSWGQGVGAVAIGDAEAARRVLAQYEAHVRSELGDLDATLGRFRAAAGVNVFAMTDDMLARATDDRLLRLGLQPFDLAVLASVLGRAKTLRVSGADDVVFCELDSDLQPWNRDGNRRGDLASLYDEAGVQVRGDFLVPGVNEVAAPAQ